MHFITKILFFGLLFLIISSCVNLPKNNIKLFQRSMIIQNSEMEKTVLAKASVTSTNDPDLNHIKILHLKGTPYEMGFQHGRLLQKEIHDCINHVMQFTDYYIQREMMDEVYDLIEPYIPIEDKEEMRGLAHGSGLPLRLVHWYHTIPALSEYKYKKRFSKGFKGTSCSNMVAFDKASCDGKMYQMRVLDWNRRMGVHKWPVIIVYEPDLGNASVSYSFAGFTGCVTGMNEKHMAFGEKGHGNPANENLEGIPFVFLFKKLMREAGNLDEAVDIIKNTKRTCSYVYLISDAKKYQKDTTRALLFITDREQFITFKENMVISDKRDDYVYPAIDDVLYYGAESKELYHALTNAYGKISPAVLMEISKKIALKGNIQNVIFKPDTLESWSTYAASSSQDDDTGKACNQKWFYFNFKKELE